MFKKFFRPRKPTEIETNSARIEALHSELTQRLTDPTVDPKAPYRMTPEFKALQDEYVALINRNVELMYQSSQK